MKLYQKIHDSKTKNPQLSGGDINNFSYTIFNSAFICIYVFINIAEQFYILTYILSTKLLINYYFLLSRIHNELGFGG